MSEPETPGADLLNQEQSSLAQAATETPQPAARSVDPLSADAPLDTTPSNNVPLVRRRRSWRWMQARQLGRAQLRRIRAPRFVAWLARTAARVSRPLRRPSPIGRFAALTAMLVASSLTFGDQRSVQTVSDPLPRTRQLARRAPLPPLPVAAEAQPIPAVPLPAPSSTSEGQIIAANLHAQPTPQGPTQLFLPLLTLPEPFVPPPAAEQPAPEQAVAEQPAAEQPVALEQPAPAVANLNRLLEGTALAGLGQDLLDMSTYYRVPPELAVAMFQKESQMGTTGVSRENNNPGNLRFTGLWGDTHEYKGFAVFPSMRAGMEGYFRLLNSAYRTNLDTDNVPALIQRYAPPWDGNDTDLYQRQMAAWMPWYRSFIHALPRD